MEQQSKTIAVLGVDGEDYAVNGIYIDKAHKPSWYTLIRSKDNAVCVEHLDEFPSHDKIRELVH